MKRTALYRPHIVIGMICALATSIALGATWNQSEQKQADTRKYQTLHIPEAISGKDFQLELKKRSKSFWAGATTITYGYNNESFWGPTLFLNQGDDVKISVKNSLDEPTTTHWHGLHIPAVMDGGPHQVIPAGKTWNPKFKVMNNAGLYWYHPHVHESTQRQITFGAGGLIIIKDPKEAALALPREYGVDDIPLVLTSRRFYQNNEFTHMGDNDKYGDYLFVNGTLDPQVSLPAQFVRLRILNAEVERGYNLGFADNRTFYVIGTDGGLVDKPIPVTRVKLMVGERVELLVDLGKDKVGGSVDLMSFNYNHPFGFPGGEPDQRPPNGSLLNNKDFQVLHINLKEKTAKAIAMLPTTLAKNTVWKDSDVTQTRTVRINGGRPNFFFDNNSFKMHSTNQTVKLGAVEKWTVVNNNIFGHSFHIHDVQFRIVERSSGPVADYEQGWKDTVYVPRGETVTFIAKFEDFASEKDPYMYHCHMANHEDGGLMGEFLVVEEKKSQTQTISRSAAEQSRAPAAPFVGADLDCKPLSLSDLAKDKPVLLFFIELNCPCSIDAAPYFNQLQAAYGSTCNVVGIINAKAGQAKEWAKKVGSRFPLFADPDMNVIKSYGAERSVYTTLVAPGGRLEKTYPGYGAEMLRELNQKLARLGGVPVKLLNFVGAPKTLYSGCLFNLNK